MKRLEAAANVAIILAVLVFIVVVVRSEISSHSQKVPDQANLRGSIVKLPGVTFPKQRDSLLIAVSTTCHFCEESLPFYRETSERLQGKLDVIVALPQPAAEAQKFVQSAHISASEVVSAPLSSIGVAGTPTLLLLDREGKVKRVWIGKLSEEKEREVLSLASQK